MKLPYPVIVVPGITATYLRDLYPLSPETVWAVIKKQYDRISLHPADLRYEAQQPANIQPDQIYEIAYKELVGELRKELTDVAGNKEVPVYPFGYDWRMPLQQTQERLASFIDDVIGRTRLMPHYRKVYGDKLKVVLVGHSMGGLVISSYLANNPNKVPVAKVATLATPYRGSFEAIVKLTIGTGNIGEGKPSHSERRAARVTPALYSLLPSFDNGLDIADGLPKSMFDPQAWQPSVTDSLSDYIKETAYPTPNRTKAANELFAGLLKQADQQCKKIAGLDIGKNGLTPDDWLAVVGVDTDTRVKTTIKRKGKNPVVVFDHHVDVMNKWREGDPKLKRLTGDGTVPYEGAVPPFAAVKEKNLVLITPDDYGFWEFADKGLTEFGGFHGILPNMDLVRRLLIRFITGATDSYGNTWGRPAPGVSKSEWAPPIKLKARA